MSRRVSAEWLDDITSRAEKWRRRCNDQPVKGILVTARSLRVVLAASENVSVNGAGVISWNDKTGRRFAAIPIHDDPAEVPATN